MMKSSSKSKKIVYGITLLTMIILMVIFLNSFYWPYEEVSKRKVVVWATAGFGIFILPILCVKCEIVYCFLEHIIKKVQITIEKTRNNYKKKIVRLVGVALGFCLLSLAVGFVCRFVLHTVFNLRMIYLIAAVYALIILMIKEYKTASKKPEKIFFCIAMIMGIFCIGVTPSRVGVSWDDEIHYTRTLEISNLMNGIMYEADVKNISEYADNIYATTGYDRESDAYYTQELNFVYNNKGWSEHQFSDYNFYSVSYIPAAIGIIFARGLGLSYSSVFNMGRLFNLIMYVSLIYASIRRVKYGKILIATIGLIPTTIFMATSYSYDPWVTGFILLGFAYFVAELQHDELLDDKTILIINGAVLLGGLPKMTYFPMLLPLLFMPKKKFKSAKQRGIYYLTVIGTGVILVSTYLLPMFMNGAGTGDIRGGADVNSVEQIKFILENPLQYMRILFKFCSEYVSLGNSGPMLQRFAYVGNGCLYGVVCLVLVVITFLDRGENEKNFYLVKWTSLLGCAVAILVSATALYVGFTPVASETVAGMQGRYIVPTIYVALSSLGLGGVKYSINKNAFTCIPMLIVAGTFIINLMSFCIIGY